MDENESEVVGEFSCSACNYFYSDHQLELEGFNVQGECRYNPPVALSGFESVFPRADPDDWCGKWKRRGWLRQLERGEL